MSTQNIVLRNPKKGFYATILKIPKDLQKQKTIVVGFTKRAYLPKYKRFYQKSSKYHVHCDLQNPVLNQVQVKSIKLGDQVFCTYTRRISKTKSAAVLFKQ